MVRRSLFLMRLKISTIFGIILKGDKMKKSLLIIVIYLLFFACLTGTKAKSLERYRDAKVTRVTSVCDGNTFRCNIEGYPPIIGDNIPVRIKGIDTPELRDKRKDVKELAHKAKDFITRKLQTAKIIRLRNIERGKYFRILADVEVDGENLGDMLLDKGLANPCQGRSKAAWDTTKKPLGFGNSIVYRGKKRTQKWFDRMYERFSDKIICIDGKYINKEIKKKVIYLRGEVGYPKGTVVAIPDRSWNVLQALGNGEALIIQKGVGLRSSHFSYRESDALFHLSGYQGQLTDDESLSLEGYLISNGIYEYTTALGAKKTVQSFVFYQHQPLTREQFADAIKSGFKLISYEKRGEKIVERPIR